jgi:hypothetical protein
MFKKILLTTALTATAFGASNAELESRIEDLEFANYANFWSFSGELETRYDTVNVEKYKALSRSDVALYKATTGFAGSNTYADKVGSANNWWSVYSRINVQALPSDRLSFFGRLSMSKRMNNFNRQEGVFTTGINTDDRARGRSLVLMERAFFNYKLTNSLILTAGRLPTIDGPPLHMTSGKPRSGTYPKLAYGAVLDGIALTHSANVGGGSLSTRAIYMPFSNDWFGAGAKDISNNAIRDTENAYTFMADYTKLNVGFARRMNLVGQYIYLDNYFTSRTQSTCTSDVCQPYPTRDKSISDLYFNYTAYLAYAEFNGLAGTGLDFSVSYKKTKVESRGAVRLADAKADAYGIAGLGVYHFDGKAHEDSDSILLLTLGYRINSSLNVGLEYIDHGAEAWNVDFNTQDAVGFYNTPGGKGQHVYLTYKMDNNLRYTLGYMTIESDTLVAAEPFFGPVSDVKNYKRTGGYLSVMASF